MCILKHCSCGDVSALNGCETGGIIGSQPSTTGFTLTHGALNAVRNLG